MDIREIIVNKYKYDASMFHYSLYLLISIKY